MSRGALAPFCWQAEEALRQLKVMWQRLHTSHDRVHEWRQQQASRAPLAGLPGWLLLLLQDFATGLLQRQVTVLSSCTLAGDEAVFLHRLCSDDGVVVRHQSSGSTATA
jgi:hypothetical protein